MEEKTLGERLRNLRYQSGLSQIELAQRLLCHQTSLSQYERNIKKPNAEILMALANFYHVSTDYILYGETRNYSKDITNDIIAEQSKSLEGHPESPKESSVPHWSDLAHTLTKAMAMHEETARIQAETMRTQVENERLRIEEQAKTDRLRIEKVDAVAQDNFRRLLDRLEQLPMENISPHSIRRDDEGTAQGPETLVG